MLGSIPVFLFLATFSVNVFFYARMYHKVLEQKPSMYKWLVFVLSGSNLIVHALFVADVATLQSELTTGLVVWSVTVVTFFIAVMFFVYANLNYRTVQRMTSTVPRAVTAKPNPIKYKRVSTVCTNDPFLEVSYVAILCLVCFCVRVAVLPVTQIFLKGVYTWPIILTYFIFSELVPLCLMLYIFRHDASSNRGVFNHPKGPGRGDKNFAPHPMVSPFLDNSGDPQLTGRSPGESPLRGSPINQDWNTSDRCVNLLAGDIKVSYDAPSDIGDSRPANTGNSEPETNEISTSSEYEDYDEESRQFFS